MKNETFIKNENGNDANRLLVASLFAYKLPLRFIRFGIVNIAIGKLYPQSQWFDIYYHCIPMLFPSIVIHLVFYFFASK